MEPPTEGETHTVERSFAPGEVRQFAELTGDTQPRHTEEDEAGRLMVHGLLTASLPTGIGSDLAVLAHTMELEFVRPVYTGETITCTWTNESVAERDDRYDLLADVTCEAGGEVVLSAAIEGLIRKEDRPE